MAWRQKGILWEDDEVPPDTNWFAIDLTGDSERVSIDLIQMVLNISARVAIVAIFEGKARLAELNNGDRIERDVLFTQEINVYPGMEYNVQHLSGMLIPSISISTLVPE